MQAAKMFHPDPFPMQGEIFERVLRTLRGSGRDNYNVLYHFYLLSKPQRWEDRLQAAQKRLCFPIFKPECWYESGAAGEFIAALQAVPVIGLHLVRRLNVLKYLAVSSYNGRVAIFSIRSLEQICSWQERVELLPPEVRTWLEDPDVTVLTSGESRTFRNKLHGLVVTNQVDTEKIFEIYQTAGVIRPAVPASRGDLAWQLSYAVGYHPLPSRKATWLQLVGSGEFRLEEREKKKRVDWPEWRTPGWQPNGVWSLGDREIFNLYFCTYGPHMFISRLIRHGLVYGGLKAVMKNLPLRETFLVFLQSSLNEEQQMVKDPLGLSPTDAPLTSKRDSSSPAVRMYNPKYAHLPSPEPQRPVEEEKKREREEQKRRAREEREDKASAAPTSAEVEKVEVFEDGEGGDVPHEEDVPVGGGAPPTAATSATAALAAGAALVELEEGEIGGESGEEGMEEDATELVIDLGEDGEGLFKEEEQKPDPNNNPYSRPDANNNNGGGPPLQEELQKNKEKNIQEALKRLAAPEAPPAAERTTTPADNGSSRPSGSNRPPPLERTTTPADNGGSRPGGSNRPPPLAHRLGPAPPSTTTQPAYYTAAGAAALEVGPDEYDPMEGTSSSFTRHRAEQQQGEEGTSAPQGPLRRGRTSPRYAPFDLRSRCAEGKASAADYKKEAASPLPVPIAVIAPDLNLKLAARTRRGPKLQRPAKEKRAAERKRHRSLSRRLLDHVPLTREEVLNNPYVEQPVFDKRCSFCSSWHCSKFLRGSRELNCTKFREQRELAPTRRLCDYRRCPQGHDHHTAVCPALHARCPVCQCRGHGDGDACNMSDERIMEKLRYDFEECADIGIYTKKRFQNLAWGFYPYPQSAPRDAAVVSYRRLSDMPVSAAIATLSTVLKLPENRPLPQGGVLDNGLYLSHRPFSPPPGGVLPSGSAHPAWEDEPSSSYDDGDME